MAQEAYEKLLAVEDVENISNLRGYLMRTARNIAIDRIRRSQKRTEIYHYIESLMLEGSKVYGPEEECDAAETEQILIEALRELPPKCQKVFFLYKYENMEYEDIAKKMNLSESMVRKYVVKALEHCSSEIAGSREIHESE